MSKKIIYLLGILLTIIIGTFLYYHYCCSCSNNKYEKDLLPITGNALNAFALNGNGFNYRCNSNFNFGLDGFEINQPINDSIDLGIQAIKEQLEMNPAQKLTITGFCTSQETNNTSFPNLGFARADKVKTFLISKGISANAINIEGQVQDSWETKDGIVYGPVNFELKELTVTANDSVDQDLAALKEKLNETPLILYFNSSKTTIQLSQQENATVTEILNYLEKVPESRMLIVGHTDNTGDKDKNIIIGQRRADFAKTFFRNKVDAKRIETSSKGQDEPISDNTTTEGKAKNRRVVITIN